MHSSVLWLLFLMFSKSFWLKRMCCCNRSNHLTSNALFRFIKHLKHGRGEEQSDGSMCFPINNYWGDEIILRSSRYLINCLPYLINCLPYLINCLSLDSWSRIFRAHATEWRLYILLLLLPLVPTRLQAKLLLLLEIIYKDRDRR